MMPADSWVACFQQFGGDAQASLFSPENAPYATVRSRSKEASRNSNLSPLSGYKVARRTMKTSCAG